jgi:serine/threonine protein kinase
VEPGSIFHLKLFKREVYGKEVDWWSLGILTYELLFSKTPFRDSNIFVANDKIKNQDPNF